MTVRCLVHQPVVRLRYGPSAETLIVSGPHVADLAYRNRFFFLLFLGNDRGSSQVGCYYCILTTRGSDVPSFLHISRSLLGHTRYSSS